MSDLAEYLRSVDEERCNVEPWTVARRCAEAAARIEQLEAALQWRPIEEAPKDGTWFLAYSQDLSGNGLPPFISCCSWHPDAGFCTDEIREPTHFMPLPPPPAGETEHE